MTLCGPAPRFAVNYRDRGLLVGLIAAGGAVALAGVTAGAIHLRRRKAGTAAMEPSMAAVGSATSIELSKPDVIAVA